MIAEVRAGKVIARALLYGILAVVLILSAAYLPLPMERKLRHFCVLDDAHLAEEPRASAYRVQGYWVCPQCGSNLAEIVIYEYEDAGMWVLSCYSEGIFWILYAYGPMKSKVYGSYHEILWRLPNALNVVAVFGIIFSVIAFLYLLRTEL